MKFVHTSITVTNMNRSILFYRDIIGMKLIQRVEIPENNAEIAFLSNMDGEGALELTWWRDKRDYVEGDQLDHLAFEVEDVQAAVYSLRKKGITIAKEPYSLKGSKSKIAFIKDPDGIWIELIQRG